MTLETSEKTKEKMADTGVGGASNPPFSIASTNALKKSKANEIPITTKVAQTRVPRSSFQTLIA